MNNSSPLTDHTSHITDHLSQITRKGEGERKKIESFEDLEVYQKLLELHLEISEISLKFPKHELYELGSQNHLQVAYRKGYLIEDTYLEFRQRYE